MTVWLAWLAIASLATYVTFIGGAWAGVYTPALRLVSILLAGGGLAVWVVVAARRPAWRPRSVLLPAILVGLASLALSTLLSRNVRVSAEYLGYGLVLAALYLLLVRLFARPFFAIRLSNLAAILFVVISAAFVALVVWHWFEWWGLVGRMTVPPLRPSHEGLTFLNPSAVLTMVALLAVPTVALVGSSSARGAIAAVAIGAVVGVVALLSGSRAGWLALGGTVVIVTGAGLASRERRAAAMAWLSAVAARSAGRVALAVAAVVVVVGAAVMGPAVLLRATEGGESLRATYVLTALRMFVESPLTGTGPGTWVIQRGTYSTAGEADYYIPHAHNLEAQALAELGLGGVVAGTVVVVSLLRLLRAAARDAAPARRRWAWATAAGLIYVALHQQLDFYANMPAVLFALALPVAYLDGTSADPPVNASSPRSSPKWLRRPAALVAVAAIVMALGGLALQEVPAIQMATAVDAANRGDWDAADASARSAADLDPAIGAYRLMAGLAAAQRNDHVRAAAEFEEVVTHNDLPEAWLDLAAEREQLGDATGAAAALDAALRLGIQRPAVAMPAGDLALRLNLRATARTAFASAIRTTPSIAGDPWWHRDAARESVYGGAVEDAISTAMPSVRWEIALMVGDVERARSLATAAGQGIVAEPIIEAWGGDDAAERAVMDRCQAVPFDLAGLAWCARIASRHGDSEGAARWRRMSEIIVGGNSTFGAELRVATSPARTAAAGNPAVFWSVFTYRRPGPSDILVPSLVHLTLE